MAFCDQNSFEQNIWHFTDVHDTIVYSINTYKKGSNCTIKKIKIKLEKGTYKWNLKFFFLFL